MRRLIVPGNESSAKPLIESHLRWSRKVTDYLGPPIRLTGIRYSNKWIGLNQQSLPP